MPKFEWKSEYVLGDETIDQQHKQLVEFANALVEALKQEEDRATVKGAFDMLFFYTKTHFKDEEEFFKSISSPLLEEHKAEHVVLAEEVENLWQDEILGFRDDAIKAIQEWVETRLVPHMQISDRNAGAGRKH